MYLLTHLSTILMSVSHIHRSTIAFGECHKRRSIKIISPSNNNETSDFFLHFIVLEYTVEAIYDFELQHMAYVVVPKGLYLFWKHS